MRERRCSEERGREYEIAKHGILQSKRCRFVRPVSKPQATTKPALHARVERAAISF
jgi:hypothetical protein